MDILIDTHILLWSLSNTTRLNKKQQLILAPGNTILASQISLIEISIKLKLGKLDIYNLNIDRIISQWEQNGFEFLPIKNHHLISYDIIPLLDEHRDPFDRLIIATAHSEKLSLMSNDSKFHLYKDLIKVI